MALTKSEYVSETEYRRLALGNMQLELHRGELQEKPGMSVEHNEVMMHLLSELYRQLDRNEYHLRGGVGRLRRSGDTYYLPDVAVIPAALVQALRQRPGSLDAYSDPLPLAVEIWSPSTGDYDINVKVADYQQRGDLEIWRIHPYERTLTAWRRQPDGSYIVGHFEQGIVHPTALSGVTIDLDALFEA